MYTVLLLVIFTLLFLRWYMYNPFRGKSVIVVGNSRELLKKKYGELIDKHDIVIRLNNFMIDGYEEHVGSKVNGAHINHWSISKDFYDDVCKRAEPYGGMKWFGTRNFTSYCMRFGMSPYDRRIFNYRSHLSPCKNPTSGTIALANIIPLCDKPVTIIGLGGFSEPGYYYSNDSSKTHKSWRTAHAQHCPEQEQIFINTMISEGLVKKL